eukprot:scaffold4243_cov126-Cylindrotheca_fusiformis.AAC.1
MVNTTTEHSATGTTSAEAEESPPSAAAAETTEQPNVTVHEASEEATEDQPTEEEEDEEEAFPADEPTEPIVVQDPSSVLTTSLAFSHTTPLSARVLLPLLCLACHAIFYYGQTAPMWKLRSNADIDVWVNATDLGPGFELCPSNTPSETLSTQFVSKRAFDTLGLKKDIPFHVNEDKDVETFTYYYAIHHLWEAKGLPGKVVPRLAAILLILFSGFWPHIKLFLLNITWFFGKHPTRTKTLSWLSTLGKWSLADVLVVCVMVGVLNLDWVVEPDDIKNGLITDMPSIIAIVHSVYSHRELCDVFLKMECAKQKNVVKISKCHACWTLVSDIYTDPEWAKKRGGQVLEGVKTSGGGLATLRVQGMSGIYAFCGAVILSIFLSVAVDIFDHRASLNTLKEEQQVARGVHRRRRRQQRQRDLGLWEDGSIQEPLLRHTSPLEVDLGDYEFYQPCSIGDALFYCSLVLLTIITAVFVFVAIDNDTMERQVHGAGPMLLHDILGVNWERNYSLRSLMWTTGAAGDWDYLLMATFGLFVVVGPAIRAVLLVAAALLHKSQVSLSGLSTMIKFIGAFCSWEVFAIAIVMVQMLMPSITNTIVNNPVCGKISNDGSCLQVEFNILPESFAAVVLGWALLAIISTFFIKRNSDRVLASNGVPTTATSLDYQAIQEAGEPTSDGLDELLLEPNAV